MNRNYSFPISKEILKAVLNYIDTFFKSHSPEEFLSFKELNDNVIQMFKRGDTDLTIVLIELNDQDIIKFKDFKILEFTPSGKKYLEILNRI